MPRNGSGQYDLPYDWNDDKANGIKVLASRMQNQDQDIATALTGSLAADGQTPLTGNLDFNGNKCVDLIDGSDAGDSINVSQAQTGELQFYGVSTTTPAGTNGLNYDLGPTPSIAVYPTYTNFSFVCHFTCIANPIMRFGSLATKTLKKSNGASGYIALEAGDMVANKEYIGVINDDISSTDIIIENPEKPIINLVSSTKATTSTQGISFLPKVITIANNSGTPNTIIDFGAGVAQADDGSLVFTVSATSKILQNSGSWAAGNNQNGLDTGARANNTPYYCFAIYNPTTLASDFLFSASKASPTLPSGYTKKCYLGALVTDGSSNIRPATWRFGTRGYILTYTTNVNDINNASATEVRTVLQTLTAPAGVFVRLSLMLTDNSLNSGKIPRVLFTEINQADVAPTTTQATLLITGIAGSIYAVNNYWQGYTDSSRQIRFRTADCDASVGVYGDTIGWEELL